MGNTSLWYLVPTITYSRIANELKIDLYIRFLCFSLDFYILKSHGR